MKGAAMPESSNLKSFPELGDILRKVRTPGYVPPQPEMSSVREALRTKDIDGPYRFMLVVAEMLSMLRELCTETEEIPPQAYSATPDHV
jgi:hypothetical protein